MKIEIGLTALFVSLIILPVSNTLSVVLTNKYVAIIALVLSAITALWRGYSNRHYQERVVGGIFWMAAGATAAYKAITVGMNKAHMDASTTAVFVLMTGGLISSLLRDPVSVRLPFADKISNMMSNQTAKIVSCLVIGIVCNTVSFAQLPKPDNTAKNCQHTWRVWRQSEGLPQPQFQNEYNVIGDGVIEYCALHTGCDIGNYDAPAEPNNMPWQAEASLIIRERDDSSPAFEPTRNAHVECAVKVIEWATSEMARVKVDVRGQQQPMLLLSEQMAERLFVDMNRQRLYAQLPELQRMRFTLIVPQLSDFRLPTL